MKLYYDGYFPACIVLWKDTVDSKIGCTRYGKKSIYNIEYFNSTRVNLCIIYPKGKRPDLGYPVNNKKEIVWQK
jgi:hypothetical protein